MSSRRSEGRRWFTRSQRRGRSSPESLPPELVAREDLIPDASLGEAGVDLLNHESIARGVAELALKANTPANIALFGPWGSGKSSMYYMIDQHLKKSDSKVCVARYDAWKYGGQDLKRHFITSVANDTGVGGAQFDAALNQSREASQLALGRWLRTNWRGLLLIAGIALSVMGITAVVVALSAEVLDRGEFKEAIWSMFSINGVYAALLAVAVLVGPSAWAGATVRAATGPPSGDDHFAQHFEKLVSAIKRRSSRLVVFIDELDRCAPEEVISTLVDLKTFLDHRDCIFIVAADRDVIEHALEIAPQTTSARPGEPYYGSSGAFLDKIFQHQFSLPPLRAHAPARFARTLVENVGGIWEEMRARDQKLFDTVVFALIPVHIRSPRRVKVLLNNFATNARITQARGISWLERASEIAVWTVLQTEFPKVAQELVQVPRLLSYIRGDETIPEGLATEIVGRHGGVIGAHGPIYPYSPDSASSHSDEWQGRRDTDVQLWKYLGRNNAAKIPDPRPDLFYLQTAGFGLGSLDPDISEIIDFASDTAPDIVMSTLSSKPPEVLKIAVPLLATEAQRAFGPGQALCLESVCRLVASMDVADVWEIVNDIAPAILMNSSDFVWPPKAIPGAIALAAFSQNVTIQQRLSRLLVKSTDLQDGGESSSLPRLLQLEMLAQTVGFLPWMDDVSVGVIHAHLGQIYPDHPDPLLFSLTELPDTQALGLWKDVREAVMSTLSDLEASGETEEVRARLRQLLASVQERNDDASMLSIVFEDMQKSESLEIYEELKSLANNVFQRISNHHQVYSHVQTAIRLSSSLDWRFWVDLLRDPIGDQQERVSETDLFRDMFIPGVIGERLIPQIQTEQDKEVLESMPIIIEKIMVHIHRWNIAAEAEALSKLFEYLAANQSGHEEGATSGDELGLVRQRVAHQVAAVLENRVGIDHVNTLLVEDISRVAERDWIGEDEIRDQACGLIERLTPVAAQMLSVRLDSMKRQEPDQAFSLILMRLRARARFGGRAIPVEDLELLDDSSLSSEVAREWLSFDPPAVDVVRLIPRVSLHHTWLRDYASTRSVQERGELWVALHRTNALESGLTAVGKLGVDSSAIEYVAAETVIASRQEDRNRLIKRLLCSEVIGDRVIRIGAAEDVFPPSIESESCRAASRLAKQLLENNTKGDSRLALQVIDWVGGPARGFQQVLRGLVVEAVSRNASTFTPPMLTRLFNYGLLVRRRTGPLAAYFEDISSDE